MEKKESNSGRERLTWYTVERERDERGERWMTLEDDGRGEGT